METAFYLFAFVSGTLVGSFLNVCIYRIPRDLSVVAPRSFCPACGRQLKWTENIPVLSYLLLRGRCSSCSHPISPRYPIVELTTGLLFLLVLSAYGFTGWTLKWCLFETLLTILFWTDLEDRLLPDEITVGGAVAGIIVAYLIPIRSGLGGMIAPNLNSGWQSVLSALSGAALLTLPIWGVALLYERVRGREALGLGDVKLLFMLGSFLGPAQGFQALLIGTVLGALVGIGFILISRESAATYELPFGTFLCGAAALLPIFDVLGHPLAVL